MYRVSLIGEFASWLLRSLCDASGYVASSQIPEESKVIGGTERHITQSGYKERKKAIKDSSSRRRWSAKASRWLA